MVSTSVCSIFAMDLSTSVGTTAETATIANMERIASPADFEFEIVSVGRDSVVAEFVSQSRITNPPYVGVKGTKTAAEKNSEYQYVLDYDKEYSFVYTVIENEIKTVYNSFLCVEYGENTKIVFDDIIKNIITDEPSRAAGTKYEVESNNYYTAADITYDDYDNHGTINPATDVDWWVVSFLNSGNANFWLGNIPAGCDYDLELYSSNGTTILNSSFNAGNEAELITQPVVAGTTYYIKIYSYSGSSSSQYLFRTKNYPTTGNGSSEIISGNVYRFKNSASNKYLNVHYGYDANYTNVYQYTDDGSIELTYRIEYNASLDAYYIYPMCSSNGRSRVLDIFNYSGPTAGCNVQIYNKNSATSDQTFNIVSVGNNKYKIVLTSNNSLALTVCGTGNGSGTGTTSTSEGNVYLDTYTGSTFQQWYIEEAADNHEDYYYNLNWNYMFQGTAAPSYISSDYGYRESPTTGSLEFHTGIDIATGGLYGINIYPVEAGEVVHIIEDLDERIGRGHGLIIEHDDTVYGSTQKLRTMYIHMQYPPQWYMGDEVGVNDIIGYVGSSGASTGPHLHFTVISNGSTGGLGPTNTIEPMFFYMDRSFTYDSY